MYTNEVVQSVDQWKLRGYFIQSCFVCHLFTFAEFAERWTSLTCPTMKRSLGRRLLRSSTSQMNPSLLQCKLAVRWEFDGGSLSPIRTSILRYASLHEDWRQIEWGGDSRNNERQTKKQLRARFGFAESQSINQPIGWFVFFICSSASRRRNSVRASPEHPSTSSANRPKAAHRN